MATYENTDHSSADHTGSKVVADHAEEKSRPEFVDVALEEDLSSINTKHVLRKMDLRLIPMVAARLEPT